ncbi:BsaA family SipW-dependent biofilm matrix protein [Lachnobacterium bovis]|uniref:BsaA family SipW-dependent biofilm matrix protein n=1 Tax=Lachnobacterium bovis TaxID=140626 RepID=UPI00047F8FB4|nr:BsaA family SipW-dependent biofilm matrix protein [Lachnobacterium bovis]
MKEILKNKKVVAGVMAAVVIIGATGTYAFYKTQTETVANTFKTGPIKTEIEEEFEGSVQPEATVKKTPRVKNTGSLIAFVRVRVFPSPDIVDYVGSAENNEVAEDKIGLLSGEWSDRAFNVATCQNNQYKSLLGRDENAIYGEPDSESEDKIGWIYSDGYYYFNRPIKPGESTEKLFSGVKIGKSVKDNFDVTVSQESVAASKYKAVKVYDLEKIKSEFEAAEKNQD